MAYLLPLATVIELIVRSERADGTHTRQRISGENNTSHAIRPLPQNTKYRW